LYKVLEPKKIIKVL